MRTVRGTICVMRSVLLTVFGVALVTSACDGKEDENGRTTRDAGAEDSSTDSGDGDGSSGTGTAAGSGYVCSVTIGPCDFDSSKECPKNVPEKGGPCTLDEAESCYYCGDVPDLGGDIPWAFCDDGKWETQDGWCHAP